MLTVLCYERFLNSVFFYQFKRTVIWCVCFSVCHLCEVLITVFRFCHPQVSCPEIWIGWRVLGCAWQKRVTETFLVCDISRVLHVEVFKGCGRKHIPSMLHIELAKGCGRKRRTFFRFLRLKDRRDTDLANTIMLVTYCQPQLKRFLKLLCHFGGFLSYFGTSQVTQSWNHFACCLLGKFHRHVRFVTFSAYCMSSFLRCVSSLCCRSNWPKAAAASDGLPLGWRGWESSRYELGVGSALDRHRSLRWLLRSAHCFLLNFFIPKLTHTQRSPPRPTLVWEE